MNILVIGGAGYIGSHVTREFLDNGHHCTVFDNLSSGRRENLFGEAVFVHGDIHDYQALLGTMKTCQFDALIHLAASKAAGESMLVPEKYSHNNISGTINILNAACEVNIKNIVFSSSAAVYGEPQYLPIDEKHPTVPENFYGFTKLEIEKFLEWYDRLKNIRYACLRYFNAAGYDVKGRIKGLELNPANLIPIIMETACGIKKEMQVFGNDYDTPDGTCIRDYIHVCDLCEAHLLALENIMKTKESVTYNLGSETGYSNLELIHAAEKVTGIKVNYKISKRRPGDPDSLVASSKKTTNEIGWKPKLGLEEMLSSAWEWHRKHPKGYR